MSKRKTYIQKLNDTKDLPKIIHLSAKQEKRFHAKTMVIAKPTDIYKIIKTTPKGKLITTSKIRDILAKKYQVESACPLTTGIFINISAYASIELKDDLPYWRVIKSNGELNPKFPNAPYEQISLLENEGFEIIKKGKKILNIL